MIKRIIEMGIEIIKSIGILLLFIFIPAYSSKLLRPYISSNNYWISNLSAIACYVILAIIYAFLYRKRLKDDLKSFKSKNIGIGIRYWLIGCLIMIISNVIIFYFVKDISANEAANRELINKMPLFSLLTICVLTPFNEEIAFRLSMKKIFKSALLYALLSGFVFGGMHVITAEGIALWYIIPYGALGFMFALAFHKTDNIYTSMILHMLHNTVTILILYISEVYYD